MKKYSKILCFVLTTLTIMSSSQSVFGATTETNNSVVQASTATNDGAASDKVIKAAQKGAYNKAIIDAEWAKAKSKPVKADKVATKSLTNNTASLETVGTYPTRPGVILVTADAYKGLIPTGHAAIVWSSATVVESVANGVTTGPNNWNVSKNTCYGVTTNGTTANQDNEASNWCYSQYGKPYNWDFFNPYTRSAFYCSQLVYASFLDLYGIDLNTSEFGVAVHPMELVNTPNTYIIYEK